MSQRNRNSQAPAPSSLGAQERAAPPSDRQPVEEDLSIGNAEVVSMGHVDEFTFSIEGELYDAWMPRIARSGDGLVPVLPTRRISDGADCLLIVPGAFNSWLRKERPKRGTRLTLKRKGVDEHTGAWKLSIIRL